MSQRIVSGSPHTAVPVSDQLPRQAVDGTLTMGAAPSATVPASGRTASLEAPAEAPPAPRDGGDDTPPTGWSPTAWRSGR